MKTKTEVEEISALNYQKILSEIQTQISQTQENIFQNVTRQKVEMAWKIGQIIARSLLKKDEKTYGKKLIKKLEKDLGIAESALYKMRKFYLTYPKIPKDDKALNWSHYRILSGIKKADERKVLEDLTKQNGWEVKDLQQEVKKSRISQIRENKALREAAEKNIPLKNLPKKKITPQRGRLFSYQIKQIVGSKKYFLDCGFGVFREIKETLSRGLREGEQIVSVSKNEEKYSIKKLALRSQELHTYKALLEKVVDGDTIRVNLDLGFGIFHHEILRLAKINSPEMATERGKKSKKVLEKILKDVPFLIVKSIKTDIYGRYVADVFLPQNSKETNLQKVADAGVYLNQLLLDQGSAEIF